MTTSSSTTPIQPVDKPIICPPYDEPNDHWIYDKATGAASRAGMRRPPAIGTRLNALARPSRRCFRKRNATIFPSSTFSGTTYAVGVSRVSRCQQCHQGVVALVG